MCNLGPLPLRIAPEDIRAEVQALADKEKDRQEAEVEAHRQAALARLNLARAEAQETLKGPLPANVRAFLASLLARTDAMVRMELSILAEIEADLASKNERLEEAKKLARALTAHSRVSRRRRSGRRGRAVQQQRARSRLLCAICEVSSCPRTGQAVAYVSAAPIEDGLPEPPLAGADCSSWRPSHVSPHFVSVG